MATGTAPTPCPPLVARWPELASACGLRPGAPALLALSGGADSVALLQLAARTQPLVACHVDHGLRPDSAEDGHLCEELCRELGIPFELRRVTLTAGGDLERRAREARYAALSEVAGEHGLETLLVAHHADDADETLLLRWTRGTHPGGLVGLRPRAPFPLGASRGPEVLRPLLTVARAELRAHLEATGTRWREDSTNRSPAATRNRIRHGLLPLLSPEQRGQLRALRGELAALEGALEARTPRLELGTNATLTAPRVRRAAAGPLAELPRALAGRALAAAILEHTGHPLREGVIAEALEAIATPGTRQTLGLRGGHRLRLARGRVELISPDEPSPPPPRSLSAGEHRLGGSTLLRVELRGGRLATPRWSPEGADLPLAAGLDGLQLRSPGHGDRVRLPGQRSRSLRRVLAEAGVPPEDRPGLAVVARGAEVLWACGLSPGGRAHDAEHRGPWLRLSLLEDRGGGDFEARRG